MIPIVSTEPTEAPAGLLRRVLRPRRPAHPRIAQYGTLPADEARDGIDHQGSRWLQIRSWRLLNGKAITEALRAGTPAPEPVIGATKWKTLGVQRGPWQPSVAREEALAAEVGARATKATEEATRNQQLKAVLTALREGTATDRQVQRALAFLLASALRD